jgi:lipoprotein NlpD
VEDRQARGKQVAASSTYKVQRGDTLYSISFRYGLDFRQVAAANNIPAPYTIYPGQRIYLRESAPPAAASVSKAPAYPKSSAPAPATTPSTTSTSTKTRPTPSAPVTGTANPVAKTSSPASRPAPQSTSSTYSGSKVSRWRWPTTGPVTRGYSSSVHKGIDIGGKRGDPVQAVADGKVVYAGSGIVGFGELLIIKHNEVYLSAYGHNDRLLVREDQLVRAGQKIAEKGSSGTDTVKLHFEIRKEGKPVDPEKLLPRR